MSPKSNDGESDVTKKCKYDRIHHLLHLLLICLFVLDDARGGDVMLHWVYFKGCINLNLRYFLEEENCHPKITVQLLLLKRGRNLLNGKGQLFSRYCIL